MISYDDIRKLIVRSFAALGEPKIYSSADTPGGGGTGIVQVKPSAPNTIWIFDSLSAYHTDTGNNRTVTIYRFVGASYAGLWSQSVAPEVVNVQIQTVLNLPFIYCSPNYFIQVDVASLTAGKSLALRGSYYEITDLSRYLS